MTLLDKSAGSAQQTVDLRINILELPEVGAFWMRDYPTHRTFVELYQDCVHHPEVARQRKVLERVRASRHFWFNETLLRRDALLESLITQASRSPGTVQEISLTLRRDYYHIYPAHLLKTKSERNYIDAEKPVQEIIREILVADECPDCFHLGAQRGKSIAGTHSLADERCWPAWEEAPENEFPARARLMLRPHVSWQPYALYVMAIVIGLLVGYYGLAATLVRLPA